VIEQGESLTLGTTRNGDSDHAGMARRKQHPRFIIEGGIVRGIVSPYRPSSGCASTPIETGLVRRGKLPRYPSKDDERPRSARRGTGSGLYGKKGFTPHDPGGGGVYLLADPLYSAGCQACSCTL
jgi:hypothetical protein